MTEYSGGKFRKKKVNFSMISNEILRDSTISLKTKGLYSVIQSFITLDDFTLYKGYLQSICTEGERAFDGAWRELKAKGYLVQHKMRKGAKTFYYEYELLDSPIHPQNVGVADVDVKNVDSTKDRCINNTLLNNTLLNNNVSNHIVSERDVSHQIGYDSSLHDDFIENLILIMVDVLNMPDQATIRVNQADQQAKVVKERFRKLRYKHIEYIKLVFSDFTGEISSMRSYLISTLFNAVATCDIYFSQRVQHDMYGEGEQQWKAAK